MSSQTKIRPLVYLFLMFSFLAGCKRSLVSDITPGGTNEAIVAPTSLPSPTPTVVLLPATPMPTTLPPLRFDNTPFSDTDGLYELIPPLGWDPSVTRGMMTFNAPDYKAGFLMQVTNTGYLLDDEAFGRFANARTENAFSHYNNFSQLAIESNYDENEIWIRFELTDDSKGLQVKSVYRRMDHAIFMFEYWAEDFLFEYIETYIEDLIKKIIVNPDVANGLPMYDWVYQFEGPEKLFSFEVPSSWLHSRISRDLTQVDRFESPDEHAIIESILYFNEEELTKSQASLLARSIISNQYSDDILIVDDQVQSDGSERYTWISYSKDIGGRTFFLVRDSTFMLFTVRYDNSYENLYKEVLEYSVGTYLVSE